MSKIYLVNSPTGKALVRAKNNIQAIRHVADRTITAAVATQDELIAAVTMKIQVEDATMFEEVAAAKAAE